MVRLILLLMVFVLSAPSYAANIDAEGARSLKTMFREMLDQQRDILGGTPDTLNIIEEGEITVEPHGTYYAVTLPYLKFQYPNGARFDLGMISINASPGDVEGRWKMAMALPTPMVAYDETGKSVVQVSIGAQRAAGIWDESLKTYVKYDMLLSNVSVKTADESKPVEALMPELILRYDFREGASNMLTGNGFFIAKNMRITGDKQDTFNLNIDNLKADFTVKNFDVNAYQAAQKRLNALTKQMTTEGVDGSALGKEMVDTVLKMYYSFGDQMSFDYTIKGIKGKGLDKKTGKHETFSMDNVKLGFDIGGFITNKVFMGLAMGYDGLSFSSAKMPKDIMPSDVKIDLAFQDIPLKEVSQMGQNTMQAIEANPDAKGMAGLSLMMRLPSVLSQAGTKVAMNDNYIGNDKYRFSLNGEVLADISAVNSATALVNATFKGLDTLITSIQSASNANPDDANKYASMLQQLMFLQSIGKKSTGGNTYMYKFEMTPAGQMLLNGQDAKAVMGGAP